MSRKHTIRKAKRSADLVRRGADVALWLVVLLAVCYGGAQAITGAPILASLLVPPGLMAAEAGDTPHVTGAAFPIQISPGNEEYGPHVLAAGQGFPEWLKARIAFARGNKFAGTGAAAPRNIPTIAIVIDDLGADVADTRRAIALPKEITLSFLPYPDASPALAREGLRGGHEIILHVPMEPEGSVDPGPNALLTRLSADENVSRLNWALSRIEGYSGINNHEGSKFTADRAALVPVMEQLAQRHVFYLDSRTTPDTVAVPLARAFGVPSAGRDVFLDDVQTADAINAQLAQAEKLASQQGVLIAIGHPHAATMDVLTKWAASISSRGYELIAASEAIRKKTERDALSGSLSAAR
jgi:polysaccharide deacetylase 2 family uncharacterized protein YibQ